MCGSYWSEDLFLNSLIFSPLLRHSALSPFISSCNRRISKYSFSLSLLIFDLLLFCILPFQRLYFFCIYLFFCHTIDGDRRVSIASSVLLDGSDSFDPDLPNSPLRFDWDCFLAAEGGGSRRCPTLAIGVLCGGGGCGVVVVVVVSEAHVCRCFLLWERVVLL